MRLHIFSYPSSTVYVSEPYLKLLNKILYDFLGRKYGFQELEYYYRYLHHVTNGIDHQSILLEMVDIISIFHGCMVWIEKSVTRVTDRHHEACQVMPDSDPE